MVSHNILTGNPSPLFLAADTNQGDILDILLLMVVSCPQGSVLTPQSSSDGMSVLDVAASKGYHSVLEKLIRSEIFSPEETGKACREFGYFQLLRKYTASPLLLLTESYPMFQEECFREDSKIKKG